MKKYIILLAIFAYAIQLFAQEETEKVKDTPVSPPFESGILIDAQTTVIPDARTLEFIIQHKFGSMQNGTSDLWGIYAPGANVRLGLNYTPIKNFQIGIGQTKKNMYTDFNAKWTVFQQTEQNKVPVSIALYGVFAIDGRNEDAFGTGDIRHSGESGIFHLGFDDRFSYFSQLIIGRKFCDWFSLQAGASFTHYNLVDHDYNHDIIGAHVNGRIKFSPQGSLMFTYDHPLKIKNITEQSTWDTHAKPNLAFGVEIFTFTHAFQIYVGTADGIIPQDIMTYNQNDWKNKGLAIGFTITRLWMF
ncbi:DUF5777 family beta-barrel protein [Prolixibacteraceae bacterium Z1-6]|uniref:DUF5777 family beta-barrel protein n=1 Tax=Draconibacterium aestuarii TaxID=2998507 RepID=A0A9X3J8C8_9BACT|nr:DUF5777 family beta-barrel protein [Prolixibacteraceae bacterium Z1-6]